MTPILMHCGGCVDTSKNDDIVKEEASYKPWIDVVEFLQVQLSQTWKIIEMFCLSSKYLCHVAFVMFLTFVCISICLLF